MLVQCESCHRHVRESEEACPFCSARREARRRTALKLGLAGAAGVAMMTIGIGCAYGMPEEGPDAGDDAGADAGADAPDDASGQ
jgi:hypothetical protein